MKRIFSLFIIISTLVMLIPFPVGADTIVNSISLTLDPPEKGKTPPVTAAPHGLGYRIHDINWYDRSANRFLEQGEKIQANRSYTATLWVEAIDGYDFACVNDNTPAVTAKVNGSECKVSKAFEYKAWAMVTVEYDFDPVPANGWISTINLTIPQPAAGQSPFYGKIQTEKYSLANVYFSGNTDPNMKNGISWYNEDTNEQLVPGKDTFVSGNAYKFHCLIFPEDGYSFTDNATVRVNGNTAEVSKDYATFLSVNYVFPKISTHTHTPSEWRTTGIYHYKVCTVCGDMLEQEDHKGGIATCTEKGKCSVCRYAYLEENENHTPDTSKWVARTNMYHFHPCKNCGAHCDIEDHRWSPRYHSIGSEGHAYQCADCKGYDTVLPHVPGPAATNTTPQTCTECSYIIKPAINHKHDLTRVPSTPATCTEDGNVEYYFCTGCNDCFTDSEGKNKIPETTSVKTEALGHTASEELSKDENFHWRICTVCKTVLDASKQAHEMKDNKCTSCGYSSGDPITTDTSDTTDSTDPVSTDKDNAGTSSQISEKDDKKPKDDDSSGISKWLWIGIIPVAAFVLAGIIIIVIYVSKKAKKQ